MHEVPSQVCYTVRELCIQQFAHTSANMMDKRETYGAINTDH